MAESNADIVRRFADEVITRGEIDRAGEFAWEDVVEQVPLPGQGPGLDGLRIFRGRCGPDFRTWCLPLWSRSARATKWRAVLSGQARTSGSLHGDSGDGQDSAVWGVVIDRLVEGRIKETRIIMDTMGLLMQLGVLPGSRNYLDYWPCSELGVGLNDVGGDGADEVDVEVVVFGVLKGRGDEFLGEATAAVLFGDFGVPDRSSSPGHRSRTRGSWFCRPARSRSGCG